MPTEPELFRARCGFEPLAIGYGGLYKTGMNYTRHSEGIDQDIDPSLDLEQEIARLKKEKNAIILAHFYQVPEIQDIADFLGDSLQLAQQAKKTTADVICFAGVHFMAETAKILNPERIVVVPDLEAGCSLADGCPVDAFRAWRAKYPDAVAVSYINCSAAVKAESDWICTSANAVRVVQAIPPEKQVLFAPDRNLGRHVMKHAGREMQLWPSTCIVHETFSERKIIDLKERHKDALFIAHPECEPAVLRLADYVGSTMALLRFVQTQEAKTFIVGTEPGILHQMKKAAPDKTFLEAPPQEGTCACNECPHMKRNSLEKIYLSLRDLSPRVEVPEQIAVRALVPIERMLSLS